jgi:hypothetical protein
MMDRGTLGRRSALLTAALVLGIGIAAGPQTVTLDEGTFRVSIGGREVGTETFRIQKNGTGSGAVIIDRGRVALDAKETTTQAQLVGETLRPTGYDVEVKGADEHRIRGQVVGNRFSARIVSQAGENMREYVVSDEAVLVDQGIAHHYYFVVQRLGGESSRLPLLIPQENRQVMAQVSVEGTETIQVGGESLSARRILVRPAGGAERTVWADAQGRILRVRVPSSQYVAERMAPPK